MAIMTPIISFMLPVLANSSSYPTSGALLSDLVLLLVAALPVTLAAAIFLGFPYVLWLRSSRKLYVIPLCLGATLIGAISVSLFAFAFINGAQSMSWFIILFGAGMGLLAGFAFCAGAGLAFCSTRRSLSARARAGFVKR